MWDFILYLCATVLGLMIVGGLLAVANHVITLLERLVEAQEQIAGVEEKNDEVGFTGPEQCCKLEPGQPHRAHPGRPCPSKEV